MQTIKEYNWFQISFFRVVFGLYLLTHFIHLLTVGTELFSTEGVIPVASMNLTYNFFPNILYIFDSPQAISVFLISLATSSVFFIMNKNVKFNALFLWYGFACLFHRNNFILNPSIAYVGWIRLVFIVLPRLSSNKDMRLNWSMPKLIFEGGWLITGLSYTISGLHKMTSPSWQSGEALFHLLDNPLARDYFLVDLVLGKPDLYLMAASWGAVLLEILVLPLILFKHSRKYIWMGLIFLHIGILATINFSDLTIGMIIFHLFLFDPRWLKPKKISIMTVFYDETCGVCNGFIQFILKNNSYNNINFCPLTEKQKREKLDSLIVQKDDQAFDRSMALIIIFKNLDGIYPLARILIFFPRIIRDKAYEIFAMYRHRIFPNRFCELLSPEELAKFRTKDNRESLN